MAQSRRGAVSVRNGVPYADPDSTLSLLPAAAQGEWMARHAAAFCGRLLDLGCGNQPYRGWYEPLVDSVVAYDLEPARGVGVIGSAEQLPFREAVFDCVLASEVLEHVSDAEAAVGEISRVLRPGGTAVVTVPFIYPVHEAPHDHRRFTQYGLAAVLRRHGLEPSSMEAKGGVGVLAMHWGMQTGIAGVHAASKRLGRPVDLSKLPWARKALIAVQQPAIRRGVARELSGSSAWATLGLMVLARRRDSTIA